MEIRTLVLLFVLICGSIGASLSSFGTQSAESANGILIGIQRRWGNLNRAYTLDNQVSQSTGVGNGQFTYRLEIRGFNFGAIPDDAVIDGVEVAFTRSASDNGGRDQFVGLIVDNTVVLDSDSCGRTNCNAALHQWALTPQKNVLGDSTDLWGITLDVAQVKGSNFGIALRATNGQNGNRDFSVDAVEMTVHFTSATYDKQQANAGKVKNAGAIAAAVIIPLLCIGGAIALVVVYFHLKKTRPEMIEGWTQKMNKRSESKRESNIDLEKAKEAKPLSAQDSSDSYATQPTEKIGEAFKEPNSPSVAKGSIELPNNARPRPPRPSSAMGPYNPSPTNVTDTAYRPSVTLVEPSRPSSIMAEPYRPAPSEPRGSALGASMQGSESPVVAKYHKSGKNAFSETLVFGAPIDIVRTKNGVPVAVEDAISYLENRGYKEEGIVRLAGSNQEIKAIKEAYDKGQDPDFSKQGDIHSISGALKLYFRDLPQRPLIMTKGIRQASASTDENEIVEIMKKEFDNIPEVNYLTLKRLFLFLNKVAAHSSVNRMPPDNLAIVFQPTLNLSKPLIIALINHPEVFAK